jgi:DNA-binding MurR/RpiR family transcriptional regulator
MDRASPTADDLVDLQARIAAAFPSLAPKQQRVARFMATNEALTAFTSATELAGRVGVDPATVVRFAQTLGFAGYPDLQRHLRARFPHHDPSFPERVEENHGSPSILRRAFAQDHENLRAGLELVDERAFEASVEAIGRAPRIVIFGSGVAIGLVMFLATSLRTMGFPVEPTVDDGPPLHQALARLDRDDLVIGLAFYRYVGQTVSAFERAGALGADRIAITDSPLSPLARLAEHVLCAPVESISHRVSLVAPLAVANALIAACSARHPERVAAMLRRLDDEYRVAGLLRYE